MGPARDCEHEWEDVPGVTSSPPNQPKITLYMQQCRKCGAATRARVTAENKQALDDFLAGRERSDAAQDEKDPEAS